MKKTKLILLFSDLNNAEIKQFEDFVSSPLFNKSEQVIDLFLIIKNFVVDSHISLLTKAEVSKQLFPYKKEIAENNLRVAMAKLTKLLEQFLAFQKYQKDEHLKGNYLLEALLERNQDKFVGQHLQKVSAKRNKTVEKSIDFYADELLFLRQKQRYSLRQPKKKQNFQMQTIFQTLDTYYVLQKLKYACYVINRKNIYKNETILDDIETLLKKTEKASFYENKAVEMYFFCFKMLETEEAIFFQQLKRLLEINTFVLSENEQKNMYALSLNFCNKKIRNGENYYRKMLDIYLLMLEKGFLHDGKFVYHKYLKNIVTTALKAEEFELAREQAESYKEFVEPRFRKTLYHLNIGAYHFYKREFEKAQEHFVSIKGITIDYEINRRNLLLKLYYETDSELFGYEVNNFRHFIRNNKSISEKLKKGHLNFAKIILKLYYEKTKRKVNQTILAKIKQKVVVVSPISDKKWLLEELGKLL